MQTSPNWKAYYKAESIIQKLGSTKTADGSSGSGLYTRYTPVDTVDYQKLKTLLEKIGFKAINDKSIDITFKHVEYLITVTYFQHKGQYHPRIMIITHPEDVQNPATAHYVEAIYREFKRL